MFCLIPAHDVELVAGVLRGGLHPEDLGAVVPGLGPDGLQLQGEVLGLHLPLVQHLVEVAAPLLADGGRGPLALY